MLLIMLIILGAYLYCYQSCILHLTITNVHETSQGKSAVKTKHLAVKSKFLVFSVSPPPGGLMHITYSKVQKAALIAVKIRSATLGDLPLLSFLS